MRSEPLCPILAHHTPTITQTVIKRSAIYQHLASAAGGFQLCILTFVSKGTRVYTVYNENTLELTSSLQRCR